MAQEAQEQEADLEVPLPIKKVEPEKEFGLRLNSEEVDALSVMAIENITTGLSILLNIAYKMREEGIEVEDIAIAHLNHDMKRYESMQLVIMEARAAINAKIEEAAKIIEEEEVAKIEEKEQKTEHDPSYL